MKRNVIRYSEAFKLKVVNELESGKLSNFEEARKLYGIKGSVTVQNWLRNYGKNHLLCKVIKVETADEQNELKKLKARIKQLEKVLVETQIDLSLERSWFEIACERSGVDVNEFKKKHDLNQPTKRAKKSKSTK